MPSLSTSHSCGCIRRRKLRRGAQRLVRDARGRALARSLAQSADGSGFTAVVSNVLLQFSRVAERKSRVPYPLARLTPTEPLKRHRGKSGAAETEERECRGNTKGTEKPRWRGPGGLLWGGEWGRQRTGSGGEGGGGWEGGEGHARRKERLKKSAIKRERTRLGLFKLGDAQSLLLALPTCISGSLETFKLHL